MEKSSTQSAKSHYVVMEGKLRWTSSKIQLTCIHGEKTRLIMADTHEGEEATILAVELWLYGLSTRSLLANDSS